MKRIALIVAAALALAMPATAAAPKWIVLNKESAPSPAFPDLAVTCTFLGTHKRVDPNSPLKPKPGDRYRVDCVWHKAGR